MNQWMRVVEMVQEVNVLIVKPEELSSILIDPQDRRREPIPTNYSLTPTILYQCTHTLKCTYTHTHTQSNKIK